MSNKPYRPRAETIRKVVNHLEKDLGLSIYGQHVDVKNGQIYDGLSDYNAEEIIALRKHIDNDTLVDARIGE